MEEIRNVDFEARSIPFTQFMRPHGRREPVRTEDQLYNDEVLKAAQSIIDVGFEFQIEELMNGMISMTISDNDGDYVQELCLNGAPVPVHVCKMILKHDIETLMSLRDRQNEEEEEGDE